MHVGTGEVFADRYRVLAPLGHGGMGHVHRAFDLRLRRPVALKLLHETLSAEPMARMIREARLAASLSHPNIVAVFDVGEHQGIPFMAMELVEGRQLRLYIGAPVPIQDKVRWLADVARALEAAHRANLVHRDIKPQNVMVTPTGAKILDFGIAKELDAAALKMTALLPALRTQPGFSVGTPQYMAPEILRGEHPSDPRSDQFSWGIVAYLLLAGRPAVRENLLAPWVAPRLDVPGLGERTAAVVMRSLQDDRSARFESMAALLASLEGSMQPLPATMEQGARSSNPRAAVSMPASSTRMPSARPLPEAVRPTLEPPPRPEEPRPQPEEPRPPTFQPTRLFPIHLVSDAEPKPTPDAPAATKAPAASSEAAVREPKRAVLQPLVDAVLRELAITVPLGFRKAILIVTLDLEGNKARYFVQLVALDDTAELWSPDASPDLVQATGSMIMTDAKDGNGRWQRLVLRLQKGSRDAVISEVV